MGHINKKNNHFKHGFAILFTVFFSITVSAQDHNKVPGDFLLGPYAKFKSVG